MRIFFAADIDREVTRRVDELIARLRRLDPEPKWVKPGNHHITISFFGEADDGTREALEAILSDAARKTGPFEARIRGISGFPSLDRPRVIWVGVENPGGELASLYDGVREGVLAGSLPVQVEERGYTPHLTICRVKFRCSPSVLAETRALAGTDFGAFTVRDLVLYRSTLGGGGAVYVPLRRFNLA